MSHDNSNVAQHAKVLKNVSVSAYQRLGLVSDPKSAVSISVSISWKVGTSRSRSRLGLKAKRLGLVLERLVYIPASNNSQKNTRGTRLNLE